MFLVKTLPDLWNQQPALPLLLLFLLHLLLSVHLSVCLGVVAEVLYYKLQWLQV